jgi:hypothetical protein
MASTIIQDRPAAAGADKGEGERVRSHQVAPVADALAEEERADEARHAGIDVHHRAAREVEGSEAEEIAFREPYHVGHGEVDEGDPQGREQHHGRELDALGEGADDQRRSNRREGELESDEGEFGNRHARGEGVGGGIAGHTGQEGFREAADDGAENAFAAGGEGEGIAIRHPQDGDEAEHREDLHEHREHVLGAHETAIE